MEVKIYKVKFKHQIVTTNGSKRLYLNMYKYTFSSDALNMTEDGQFEIDRPESRLWYKNCLYTEVTNTILIQLLQGTTIQKLLALNIIFRT